MEAELDLYRYSKIKLTKLFSFPGATLQVSAADGGPELMYCKLKAFKLKEDITLYRNKDMNQEIINIKARQIMDFSAAYDVTDSLTKQPLGVLKRHGWQSSMFKDQWSILDTEDNVIGEFYEENATLAIFRRLLLGAIIPQKYVVSYSSRTVAKVSRTPIINILNLDFECDREKILDRKLGIAVGVVLCLIEGMQN